MKDLARLEVKLLPDKKEWAIWNASANDWVREKTGQIDSRAFRHDIQKLLSNIIARSFIADVENKNA